MLTGINHTTWKRLGLCTVLAERAVFVHKRADVSSDVHVTGRTNLRTDILRSNHVGCTGRLTESDTECIYAGMCVIHKPVWLTNLCEIKSVQLGDCLKFCWGECSSRDIEYNLVCFSYCFVMAESAGQSTQLTCSRLVHLTNVACIGSSIFTGTVLSKMSMSAA